MTLLADVTLPGRRGRFDVRCENGCIARVAAHSPSNKPGADIDGGGGALLPGLHDHHLHLFALAAARASVDCGPERVADGAALARALHDAPGSGWVRAVGYHESVAGSLDRWRLDALLPHRPLRLQHRSGKLWMLNSAALARLGIGDSTTGDDLALAGIERDGEGRPTGRLFRLDAWLGQRLAQRGEREVPSLAPLSALFASYGVTGVTDTTPDNGVEAMALFEAAADSGWRQRLRVMGDDTLPPSAHPRIARGERKFMLDEDRLPDWETLAAGFAAAHGAGRGVAVHCVTPAELVLALSVLREVGAHPADRIEHASLVPTDVLPLLRESGVRVVTQPGFVRERGAQYRRDIDPAQHGDLYRCRTLLGHGIRLAGSTDAPYGDPDPWSAMRAAVSRRARDGAVLSEAECLTPEQALALFTSAADDPGGASRRVAVGQPADLCLLSLPWASARRRLSSDDVLATVLAGEVIYRRGCARGEGADAAVA